jgi:tRNA U34 5-carboxymethylaminomethyl modifying enzyme MnmG/GidA
MDPTHVPKSPTDFTDCYRMVTARAEGRLKQRGDPKAAP